MVVRIAESLRPNTTPLSADKAASITLPGVPPEVKRWEGPIVEMAKKYNIDPNLIAIIMTIESGGNPQAVSQVNAQGLMQVMPYTAKDIAAKHLKQPVTTYDLKDPRTNIEFGTAYLAYLRSTFGAPSQGPSWDKTVELVAAGYNGGPGAAMSLRQGKGAPYPETTHYSQKAVALWRHHQKTM